MPKFVGIPQPSPSPPRRTAGERGPELFAGRQDPDYWSGLAFLASWRFSSPHRRRRPEISASSNAMPSAPALSFPSALHDSALEPR